MRKLFITLLAVTVLGAGSAFAQSGLWAGLSVGWPGATLHLGVENVVQNLDVRANIGSTYNFNRFSVGLDALYGLDVDLGVVPLDAYVGGGVALGVGTGLSLGIGAFGGIEYRLGEVGLPQGGIFLEVGPAFDITPAFKFGVLARLGFNYHF